MESEFELENETCAGNEPDTLSMESDSESETAGVNKSKKGIVHSLLFGLIPGTVPP